MIVNRFGIPEPDRNAKRLPSRLLSVVLLPLVGFDSDGNRLGMGGGFYDRTFGYAIHSSARRPRLIGVAYECQRSADGLPRRPWDVPLDGVVTEAGLRLITRAGKQ